MPQSHNIPHRSPSKVKSQRGRWKEQGMALELRQLLPGTVGKVTKTKLCRGCGDPIKRSASSPRCPKCREQWHRSHGK